MHSGLRKILWIDLETKGWMEVLLHKRKDNIYNISIAWQTSSSESKSRRTLSSLGFIMALATICSMTLEVQELIVSTIVDA